MKNTGFLLLSAAALFLAVAAHAGDPPKEEGKVEGKEEGTKTEDAKADPPALDKEKCQATAEDGTLIAEATAKEYKECSSQIKEAVKKAKCDGSLKKVKYRFQRGALKPIDLTIPCA